MDVIVLSNGASSLDTHPMIGAAHTARNYEQDDSANIALSTACEVIGRGRKILLARPVLPALSVLCQRH
jgi:hypothetical protein